MGSLLGEAIGNVVAEENQAQRGNVLAFEPPAPAGTAIKPTGGTGGLVSEALAPMIEEERQKTVQAFQMAEKANPDVYARARVLADKHGLPADLVAGDLATFEGRENLTAMNTILREAPQLAEWFRQQDNPRLVSYDDLKTAHGLEWMLRAAGGAARQGYIQHVEIGSRRWRQLIGEASPDEIREADRLKAENPGRTFGAEGFGDRVVTDTFEQITPTVLSAVGAAKGAIAGGAVGAAAGAAVGGLGAVPGFVGGAGIGAGVGLTLATTQMEAAGAFDEFLGMRDDNGKPLNPEIARGAAIVVGVINGAFEATGMHMLGRVLTPLKGGMLAKLGLEGVGKGTARAAVKTALARPEFRTAVAGLGKSLGLAALSEAVTEAAQEATTIAGGWAAQKVDGGKFEGGPNFGEMVDRVVEAGTRAIGPALVLGGAGAGASMRAEMGRIRQVQQQTQILQEMAAQTPNMKLRERMPEKARELVDRMTSNGPIDAAYINGERLNEYFQTKGIAADEVLPGLGQRLDEALASNGDVLVRIDDYIVKLAGTDIGDALLKDTKLQAGGLTQREAQERQREIEDLRYEAMERDEALLREIEAERGGRERVFEDLQRQWSTAGVAPDAARHVALAQTAFLQTQADRLGQTIEEFAASHGVQVRSVMEGEEAVYRNRDMLDLSLDHLRRTGGKVIQKEMRLALGQSLGSFIRERGGLQDVGGELSSRDAKKFTAKAGKGMSFDDMTLAAWEAGYFPDFQERPSQDLLLASLDEELAGRPVYRGGETEETVQLPPHIAHIEGLSRTLSDLGLDVNSLTNDEIRAEIEKAYNPDPDMGALYQGIADADVSFERGFHTFVQGDTSIDYTVRADGIVEINKVSTPAEARGKGSARSAMIGFLWAADRAGVTVALTADPMDAATKKGRLEGFYKDLGFVPNKGRGRDPSISAGMIRRPQQFQGDEDAPRGSFQFAPGGSTINLFEARNLSTFLHETGHWFLAAFQDIATTEGAPQDIVRDWQVIKDALGVGGDNVLTRDQHEQWARWTEEYFYSGKAPSSELARAFAAFAAWLRGIYRALTDLDRRRLPAEVRAVMDRMLASDAEIERQRQATEFRAWFNTAEDAGMTEPEFAAYRAAADGATDEAKEELTRRLLADVKRETTREWRERKAEVRAEVMAELSRRPVYQAFNYLRTGQAPEGVEGLPAGKFKLSRQWLLDNKGPEVFRNLPRSVPPIYTTSSRLAVHPDLLAEAFNFSSGDELVTELMRAPAFGKAVVAETKRRMAERFGDLLNDQARLSQEAVESLHGERRGELLEAELKAISRRAGSPGRSVPREVAQQIAMETISAKPVSEATRNIVHERAEKRAARAAEEALRKGDFDGAITAKKQQLMAHYLALESRRARDEVDSAVDYLRTFTGRKPPPRVAPEYVDQINGLLERFDLKKASARELDKRQSFAEFAKAAEARGEVLALPPDHPLWENRDKVNYKTMTVEDLRAVRDAVKNLDHLGTLKRKLVEGRKQREFEAAAGELAAQAARNPARKAEKYRNPEGIQWRETTLGLAANLLKIEQVVEWLDQGDINGPFRRMIWQRIADAQARENLLQAEYTAKLAKLFESFKPGYLSERVHVTALGPNVSYTREELLAFALNTGNAENLDKLLRGEKMLPSELGPNVHHVPLDNEEKLNLALDHLTATDWQAVQAIWDTINGLWPEIAKLQKRLTGVEPKKVEARPFTNKHGSFAGGYYPLVYDPRNATDARAREGAEAANALFENAYVRPTTSHGFTKERSAGYARPIATQLSVVNRHIAKVVHDVTHREAIRDAYRLLNDDVVRSTIHSRFGGPVLDEMNKWLARVANDKAIDQDANMVQWLISRTRSNITVFGLGFRASTVLAQFAGLFPSMEFVGPLRLGQSLIEYMRNPMGNTFHGFGSITGDLTAFVVGKSAEMRDRLETMDRDLNRGIEQLRNKHGVYADIQRAGFHAIGMADRVVAVPTWHAAYVQHLEQHPGDEQGAIAYGDRAVRLAQGAGGTKDISSVMQKKGFLQPFTMFYSYFNAYFNRLWALGRDARLAVAERDPSVIPSLVGRALVLSVLPALIGDLLVGKGPDSDKDEGWTWWATKKVVMMPLSSVPFLRDAANAVESGHFSLSPFGRVLEAPIGVARELYKGREAEPRKIVKGAAETVGLFAGVPAGQLVTTGNNIWRGTAEGDLHFRDLFFSRPPK